MQKAGALEIARVPAIYVFPTVKDGRQKLSVYCLFCVNNLSVFFAESLEYAYQISCVLS